MASELAVAADSRILIPPRACPLPAGRELGHLEWAVACQVGVRQDCPAWAAEELACPDCLVCPDCPDCPDWAAEQWAVVLPRRVHLIPPL